MSWKKAVSGIDKRLTFWYFGIVGVEKLGWLLHATHPWQSVDCILTVCWFMSLSIPQTNYYLLHAHDSLLIHAFTNISYKLILILHPHHLYIHVYIHVYLPTMIFKYWLLPNPFKIAYSQIILKGGTCPSPAPLTACWSIYWQPVDSYIH